MMGIYYEERPDYLFNELVADVGGSLGVILGLSLVDILIFGRRFTDGLKKYNHLKYLSLTSLDMEWKLTPPSLTRLTNDVTSRGRT